MARFKMLNILNALGGAAKACKGYSPEKSPGLLS